MFDSFEIILFIIVWLIVGIILILHGIHLFKTPKKSWYQRPDTPPRKIKEIGFLLIFIGLSMALTAIACIFLQSESCLVIILFNISFIFVLLGGYSLRNPNIMVIKYKWYDPEPLGKKQGLMMLTIGIIFFVLTILTIYLIYLF